MRASEMRLIWNPETGERFALTPSEWKVMKRCQLHINRPMKFDYWRLEEQTDG